MIGVKMYKEIQKTENVGKIVQALVDLGFEKVKFENEDGSTIGCKDHIYITAETCQWKIMKGE